MTDSLARQLRHFLTPALWTLTQYVVAAAEDARMPLFFAGGMVRDIVAGAEGNDLDFVAEGDAIALARTLQKDLGGELTRHDRFGTASWSMTPQVWRGLGVEVPPAGLDYVDFATARTETYPEPAELPVVRPSNIVEDLRRRDFTVNAMAVRLDGVHFGDLLDYHGGMADLAAGLIRILHDRSFVDDPTRIFRAVRFATRLGFRIESHTADLLREYLHWINALTGERVKYEIEMLLREAQPETGMAALDEHGVMGSITPGLSWSDAASRRFARLRDLLAEPGWAAALGENTPVPVYYGLWVTTQPLAVQRALAARLRLRRNAREEASTLREMLRTVGGLTRGLAPSAAFRRIDMYRRQPRVLLAARAALEGTPAAEYLDRYWHQWRHVSPELTGHDLKARKLPPGPRYRELLDALRDARLDGWVSSREEENAYLDRLLNDRRPPTADRG